MKLNKWLYGAAAALMLGACSDNFSDGPDSPNKPAEEAQGYIGINLQLPTVKSTRANDSFGDGILDEYVVKDALLVLFEGDSEANAVCTGAFSLDEADPSYDEDNAQITRHSVRIATVSGVSFDKNLYALVLVNGVANGLYTNDAKDEDITWLWKTLSTDEDGNVTKSGKTVRELQETIFSTKGTRGEKITKLFTSARAGSGYASNIFMTNSPLSTVRGGQYEPTNISTPLPVLVELNPKVYKEKSEAIANPAGIIHVERAVGKVTCSNFNKETQLEVTIDGVKYKLEVDQIWWDMAQDMAETYMVRNTNRNLPNTTAVADNYKWRWNYISSKFDRNDPSYDDSFQYRMLGESSVTGKVKVVADDGTVTWVPQDFYRPYFCQVPGYDKLKAGSTVYENKDFNKEAMLFDETYTPVLWSMGEGTAASGPGAFYPFENTFPVENMKYGNTTRIGFWVTFKFKNAATGVVNTALSNKSFYKQGFDTSTLYFDGEYGDPLTTAAIKELSSTTTATVDGVETEVRTHQELWDAIDKALKKEGTGSVAIDIAKLIDITCVESQQEKNAKMVITDIKFKSLAEIQEAYREFDAVPNYDLSKLLTTLNNQGTFYKYNLGRTFYEVRIKHFGDDNTPWDGDSKVQATTIDESYGDVTKGEVTKSQRNNDYLGRYGIVRNNWYDLNVRVIKNLGHPKDPELWQKNWENTPDDNKEQYIAIELRVLSWARRYQGVDF